MKIRIQITLLILCISFAGISQTISVATWKGNAKAAYSIIHDDYGDVVVDGIWKYADTIAANRGIKFTIGAISSSCENARNINGYKDPYDYAKQVMMDQHGHEIIAHSHTHSCAVGGAGWSPCNTDGWAQTDDFQDEIIGCTNSIENGTGHKPQYYIFPYDRFNNEANKKLKELGYIGSRTGWTSAENESFYRNGYNSNDLNTFYPDSNGFFRTAVRVFDDTHTPLPNHDLILNSAVDDALQNGEWANRELHNVGGTGWGSCSLDGYTKHLDYVQTKMNSGELWVGTISEVLTYQIQKLKFKPQLSQSDSITWDIAWDSINPGYSVNVANYLSDLSYTTPLTVMVDFNSRSGDWEITQNDSVVQYSVVDRVFHLHVYPHLGPIKMILKNETFPAPAIVNPIANQNLPANFDSLTFDLNHVFEDANTADEDLIYTVSGQSGITINLNNGIVDIKSQFDWEGIDTVYFSAEDESGKKTDHMVIFNVKGKNIPYYGSPIEIPFKIETEDFDSGGVHIAFFETDNYYINNYRVDSVDIKNNNGYTVLMEKDEWLEYTIKVNSTGYYDIDISGRSYSANGSAQLNIDGQLLEVFKIQYTSDTNMLVANKIYNLKLDSGVSVLRVNAKEKIDIDYINITVPSPNNLPVVDSLFADQLLFTDFVDYTIDLGLIFNDIETLDKDLLYTVSGNSKVLISLNGQLANISSTITWQGDEEIIFSAQDFNGAIVYDTILFKVSSLYAKPNATTDASNKGYIFTFDQSTALQCVDSMIPHATSNNATNGYDVTSVGGGHLVINSNGQQTGAENIALAFNNQCNGELLDLSHPDQRVMEIRIHSTVDVPQFLALLTDENGLSADRNLTIHQLTAGNWHTLRFDFKDLTHWTGALMDATQLKTVALYFRDNNGAAQQWTAGTFTIDYIKIGSEIVSCPPIYIETDFTILANDSAISMEVTAYGEKLSYQWYKNDTAVVNNNVISGAQSAELIVDNFNVADSGYYHCVLVDSCGAQNDTTDAKEVKLGAYYGSYTPIPATVEAEDFDDMFGAEIRTAADIDNQVKLGGWNTGAWAEYKLYIPDSTTYIVEMRVATATSQADYSLQLNGTEILQELVPNTGGWEVWQTIQHHITLPAGEHTFKIYINKGWFGLNWFKFFEDNGNSISRVNSNILNLDIYPNPVSNTIHFKNSINGVLSIIDLGGRVVRTFNANNKQSIDVSFLSKGVYQMVLQENNGTRRNTRFVKK